MLGPSRVQIEVTRIWSTPKYISQMFVHGYLQTWSLNFGDTKLQGHKNFTLTSRFGTTRPQGKVIGENIWLSLLVGSPGSTSGPWEADTDNDMPVSVQATINNLPLVAWCRVNIWMQ